MFKGTTPANPATVSPSEQAKPREDEGAASSIRTFTERTTMHGCQSVMQADYHVIRRLVWVILMLVSTGLFLNAFIRGISRYCSYPSSISVDIQPNKQLALPDITMCKDSYIRKSFLDSQSSSIHAFYSNHLDPILDDSLNTTSAFTFYMKGLDPLDEFISHCSINTSPFNCTDHIQPSLTFGGSCYTLSMAQYPLAITNPFAGLVFEISVNESEYFSMKEVFGVGVKLMFQQPGELPDESLAVNIQPQTDVSVAIKQTQNKRLGTPYSMDDCYAEQHADYKLSSLYTKRGCEMECYVRYFEEYVGCDYTGKIASVRDCSLFEELSHTGYGWNITSSDKCVCLRPCHEIVYSTHVTTMAHRDTLTPASTQRVKKISVHVYYPTFDVTVVTQEPAYNFNSFISDVGGQMGFFLGASILTMSECMEFLVVYVLKKLK